jgi:hypothetical protein
MEVNKYFLESTLQSMGKRIKELEESLLSKDREIERLHGFIDRIRDYKEENDIEIIRLKGLIDKAFEAGEKYGAELVRSEHDGLPVRTENLSEWKILVAPNLSNLIVIEKGELEFKNKLIEALETETDEMENTMVKIGKELLFCGFEIYDPIRREVVVVNNIKKIFNKHGIDIVENPEF